jgi:hypothetical protein
MAEPFRSLWQKRPRPFSRRRQSSI